MCASAGPGSPGYKVNKQDSSFCNGVRGEWRGWYFSLLFVYIVYRHSTDSASKVDMNLYTFILHGSS